jgi:hypothetical protein
MPFRRRVCIVNSKINLCTVVLVFFNYTLTTECTELVSWIPGAGEHEGEDYFCCNAVCDVNIWQQCQNSDQRCSMARSLIPGKPHFGWPHVRCCKDNEFGNGRGLLHVEEILIPHYRDTYCKECPDGQVSWLNLNHYYDGQWICVIHVLQDIGVVG